MYGRSVNIIILKMKVLLYVQGLGRQEASCSLPDISSTTTAVIVSATQHTPVTSVSKLTHETSMYTPVPLHVYVGY